MLVFPDGSQGGTLGGGCVEAEVKRRALAILNAGQAEVIAFQLDSDYGWDDGLICGGRMQVHVEPLRDATELRYFQQLHDLLDQRQGCCEAIVFDGQKSGLAAPSCYVFDADEELLCSLRGSLVAGHAPERILEDLPALASRPRPSASHGVAYLPVLPRCRLLIVGGGHVGQAVGNMASDLDFDVWIVDDRQEYASRARFPHAQQLFTGDISRVLADVEITPDTYCLIVTRGHNHDEEALYHLADRGARYVGMIGSKRKIKLIFDDLLAEGIRPEVLETVHAPVGIDIGSQTVAEIAISILAELVAHRNRGIVPGRPESLEIGQ